MRRKDDFITFIRYTIFKGGAGMLLRGVWRDSGALSMMRGVWRDSGALSMMRGVWRGAAGAFLFINVLYKYFV